MTDQHPAPRIHEDPSLRVVRNDDRERFELWRDEQFIGFEAFEEHEDGTVELRTTIVGEQFGRQGYARTLVTMLLEDARAQGRRVCATCPYVQEYLHRFPQYQDLLAPSCELPPAPAVREKRRRWSLPRAH
ncbi:acetyltransferase [Kocuria flava]|uniref:Acetyltransferase n=1 Tax=Kocuria flava TaxID=446860 RepID=A0A0U2P1G0_9MICC|nr:MULTISPECIES: GNAT family N-acetyltransferase [Kocuria]ALU40717.1 acetyltransferase [Kocuria flava]PLC12247.1 acetyltransferase [Kocuria flava]GEO93822.1 hypothetical protein KFL01_31280 [Kocuria flava]